MSVEQGAVEADDTKATVRMHQHPPKKARNSSKDIDDLIHRILEWIGFTGEGLKNSIKRIQEQSISAGNAHEQLKNLTKIQQSAS